MRNLALIVSIVLMLTVLSGLAFGKNVIDNSNNPQYLFTLASKSGTYDGETLTLKDVPLVVYFADRPARVAGHTTLEKFIGLWDKGIDNFKNNPPNAELSIYEESGDKHTIVIINSPEVKTDNISFKVRRLNEGDSIPKNFGHSTLFIDTYPTGVDNQVTDIF